MLPPRFHYSPYLLDFAAETRTWVTTVGRVISYGTSTAPEEEEALEPSVPELEEANHVVPQSRFNLFRDTNGIAGLTS